MAVVAVAEVVTAVVVTVDTTDGVVIIIPVVVKLAIGIVVLGAYNDFHNVNADHDRFLVTHSCGNRRNCWRRCQDCCRCRT